MNTVRKTFKNEFNNRIEISTTRVTDGGSDWIEINIAGPSSVSSNTITLMEAQHLHDQLREVLHTDAKSAEQTRVTVLETALNVLRPIVAAEIKRGLGIFSDANLKQIDAALLEVSPTEAKDG